MILLYDLYSWSEDGADQSEHTVLLEKAGINMAQHAPRFYGNQIK